MSWSTPINPSEAAWSTLPEPAAGTPLPAVKLSVYFPDQPGRPNSIDVEWAQENPAALMVVLKALLGEPDPVMSLVEHLAEVPAARQNTGNVRCERCNHRHDQHQSRNADFLVVPGDPNGGACVACHRCGSFVPPAQEETREA